ncbi:hypothetical protein PENSPDRAFT_689350 [Peniophora sp. CONT]|nr:hypothetical protein PENSPDRAFT_689350 [Peniophora sp. CONT]
MSSLSKFSFAFILIAMLITTVGACYLDHRYRRRRRAQWVAWPDWGSTRPVAPTSIPQLVDVYMEEKVGSLKWNALQPMAVMYKPDVVPNRAHPVTQQTDPEMNKDTGTDEHIERAGAPLPPLASGQIQVSVLIAMPSPHGLLSAARKLDEHWQLRECAIGSCNAPVRSHEPR